MAAIATTLNEASVQELRSRLRGNLLLPSDAGYDDARHIWNGMFDKRPALIVQPAGAADVIAAVNFAREHELLLAVRGGGHSLSGASTCDDGLMLDLSGMRSVHVDPERRTARVDGGALLGDLDHETQAFGLAVPAGTVSHTGVAGLTLGGGTGWLTRKYGLSIDNLLSVDVVTADGRLITASANENQDLFWGIRGGGGNFGVVTSFEFQLHPVGPIVAGGLALYPASMARDAMVFWRDFMASAPEELTSLFVFLSAPPAPFVPQEAWGAPMVAIGVCYAGPVEEGLGVVAPIRAFGPPAVDMIGPIPYIVLQTLIDAGNPHGDQYYEKGLDLRELSDGAIDVLVERGNGRTSPLSLIPIQILGGAAGRVPADATAFHHRGDGYAVSCLSHWTDPAEADEHIRWARDTWQALRPFASSGTYINFMGDDDVKRAFPGGAYERLVELKNKYDPTNIFRQGHNIKPTT